LYVGVDDEEQVGKEVSVVKGETATESISTSLEFAYLLAIVRDIALESRYDNEGACGSSLCW
jgi:hypothetical protein